MDVLEELQKWNYSSIGFVSHFWECTLASGDWQKHVQSVEGETAREAYLNALEQLGRKLNKTNLWYKY